MLLQFFGIKYLCSKCDLQKFPKCYLFLCTVTFVGIVCITLMLRPGSSGQFSIQLLILSAFRHLPADLFSQKSKVLKW